MAPKSPVSLPTPKTGTGSSTALGLGVLGVAALFITAGLTKQKLANVLEGELTPGAEAVSTEPTKPKTAEGPNAPNPLTLTLPPNSKALREKVEAGLKYKDELIAQIRAGKISQPEANKQFKERYPYYQLWLKQLRELSKSLESQQGPGRLAGRPTYEPKPERERKRKAKEAREQEEREYELFP